MTEKEIIKYYLFHIISVVAAFLSPIIGTLLSVGMFIFLDTITGVWAAKKSGNKVTSRGLSRIINKTLIYSSTTIVFFTMDKFILNDATKMLIDFDFILTKIIALTLISIEFYSINENFETATGKGLIARVTNVINSAKKAKKSLKDDLNL